MNEGGSRSPSIPPLDLSLRGSRIEKILKDCKMQHLENSSGLLRDGKNAVASSRPGGRGVVL